MANAVYTVEEVSLQDGSDVTLKPLPIAGLRVFMKMFEEFSKAEDEEQGLDVLSKCAAYCLSRAKPEYWDKEKKAVTEAWEEAADLPTVYKIIEVCGGIKLNDPNLLAAAAEALGQN